MAFFQEDAWQRELSQVLPFLCRKSMTEALTFQRGGGLSQVLAFFLENAWRRQRHFKEEEGLAKPSLGFLPRKCMKEAEAFQRECLAKFWLVGLGLQTPLVFFLVGLLSFTIVSLSEKTISIVAQVAFKVSLLVILRQWELNREHSRPLELQVHFLVYKFKFI